MNKQLITVFQDTQRRLWENELLCQLTSQAILCTQVFPEHYETTRVMGCYLTNISVTHETTLQASRRMVEKYTKVGVLNFANAVNPGGGVLYGAANQEEDLCRCTNLYSCLTKPEVYEGFYGYNNALSPYYSDRIIYSSNVTVFKVEKPEPIYTDEWFQVDVLTCAAPNLNGITVPDYQKLKKLYRNRVKNILAVAEVHGVQALVLGAFGCGAFMNPPELVAKAFYEEIMEGDYKNTFREIVFAVKADTPQGMHNLKTFQSVLSPWQQNPLYGKKVSILSDSISTYWGSNPEGYPVYYKGEQCLRAGIYTVNDTWWMYVLKKMGGTLLVNNSCACSLVSGNNTLAGNNDNRLYQLARNGESPDVILISLGRNDFENRVLLEPSLYERVGYDNYYQYFRTSYQMMLWKIRQIYPMADIYCATINYSANNYHKNLLKEYNNVICESVLENGCHLVDMENLVKNYESIDGVHPTAKGMQQLADGWLKGMEAKEDKSFLKEKKDLGMPILYGLLCILIILLIVLIVLLFSLIEL